jgi:TolB protein
LSYTGTPQLYVADADGKNLHALTNTASLKSSPTWSPDGKQIILACDPEGDPLLYQISANGGALQRLATGLPNYSGDPAWNPRDPDLVAFMVEQGSGSCIAVYSFKTHSSEVYDAIEGSYPCWANDGRHIFFMHLVGKLEQLYLLDTVTKKISKLTTMGASDPAFYYPAK